MYNYSGTWARGSRPKHPSEEVLERRLAAAQQRPIGRQMKGARPLPPLTRTLAGHNRGGAADFARRKSVLYASGRIANGLGFHRILNYILGLAQKSARTLRI
jgi:hypothetical protein